MPDSGVLKPKRKEEENSFNRDRHAGCIRFEKLLVDDACTIVQISQTTSRVEARLSFIIMSELCREARGDATGEDAGDGIGDPAQSVSTELLEGCGYFSDGHRCCCSLDFLRKPGMRRGRNEFHPNARARMAPPMTTTSTTTTTAVVIRLLILTVAAMWIATGDKSS